MTTLPQEYRAYLARAVALSREHMQAGEGGPFGAVIVRHGRILAEGWNQVTSTNDPTAHAEVVAIRRACAAVDTFALEGAALYASCEPCPMCLASAYWARISRIVYANTRDQARRSASTTPSSMTRCRSDRPSASCRCSMRLPTRPRPSSAIG